MCADSGEEDSGSKMQQCSHCSKTFRYRSERVRHEMSHTASFECETCSKKFSFISALRRHEKQHKRKENVKCDKCNKWFRDKELLKRHINYSHKVTLPCPECNSMFHSEQALQTHMKIHKPVSERRYKCSFPDCGKSFNFSHHLKHHELTHTNDKQHYCAMCWKGFIQYHHLKEHMKSHEQSESLKCDFPGCDKTYSTEYARKRHRLTHKAKPDSGISSDSNSCDAASLPKNYDKGFTDTDLVSCSSCGGHYSHSDLIGHSKTCDNNFVSSDNESYVVAPFKVGNAFEETKFTNSKYETDVAGCKTAVGDCIMESTSCVCAQIPKTNDENYDFTPIDTNSTKEVYSDRNNQFESLENKNIDFIDKYPDIVVNFLGSNANVVLNKIDSNDSLVQKICININSPSSVNKMCEGCECASTCNQSQKVNCNGNKNISKNNNVPNIEYRNGVIKIRDTYDIEPIKLEDKMVSKSIVTEKFEDLVPFGTCKDVIGNCIAEEGCLCARMMMDEQQAMAQEIDDITPVPKTEC